MRILHTVAVAAALTFGLAGAAVANPPVSLVTTPCALSVAVSCLFNGNITTSNSDLVKVDGVYNAQTPTPSPLLDLAGFADVKEFDPSGSVTSGTITSAFTVDFYAVKAGDFFRLYEIAPSKTFSWNTNGILVGNGETPDLSHLTYFGSGGVPEPAAWAMMLAGFVGLGSALRFRRKTATAPA